MKKAIFGLAAIFSAQAYGLDCSPLNLADFHQNPQEFLDAPLQKRDKNCRPTSFTLFDKQSVADKSFILKKDEARKTFCHSDPTGTKTICLKDISPGQDVARGRAPIESLDRASNLISGEAPVRNLRKMEAQNLLKGAVKIQPWSDWYWPIAVGQLSFRYDDEEMMQAYQESELGEEDVWTWINRYHKSGLSTPADINSLSPAEKYDVLMGDSNYTLTKSMLEAGKYYQENFGKVESWMGLCHGWAPASYMLPRPVKSLALEAANGAGTILFKPSDLKALGSLLWAKGKQQNKFVGGRCNKLNPTKDKTSGRVLDQECFDTNPGSWHMTVVSQVGRNGAPFVMDATFDYEVWNHPVTSYSYKYFNPKTMEYAESIDAAKVEIQNFNNDKFKRFRGSQTRSVVGVVMEVEYLIETMPSSSDIDAPEFDAFNSVQYAYDLELDAFGDIVGGEWYTNKHPDFLWTPYENSKAHSVVDDYIEMERLPLDLINHPKLQEMAPYASENSQPIGRVVEAMLREASK